MSRDYLLIKIVRISFIRFTPLETKSKSNSNSLNTMCYN